ncbi:MAG: RsiV family protein [Oscillibacter sp.]
MKESLTALHTEAFTAEREWTVDGIPVLTATVTLPRPVPAAGRTAGRIYRYYQLQSHSYFRYCAHWLFPQAAAEYRAALAASTPLPQWTADLLYRVTYNQGGLWSLYTQSRETGLPGQTALVRRGDSWDLASGYPVPLSAFFPRRSAFKKALLARAEQEIARQEAEKLAQYSPGWRQGLRRNFNPQNFYLTEDGLAFFYQMYAIAPQAEGVPTFLLPWNAAGPHIPPSL